MISQFEAKDIARNQESQLQIRRPGSKLARRIQNTILKDRALLQSAFKRSQQQHTALKIFSAKTEGV